MTTDPAPVPRGLSSSESDTIETTAAGAVKSAFATPGQTSDSTPADIFPSPVMLVLPVITGPSS